MKAIVHVINSSSDRHPAPLCGGGLDRGDSVAGPLSNVKVTCRRCLAMLKPKRKRRTWKYAVKDCPHNKGCFLLRPRGQVCRLCGALWSVVSKPPPPVPGDIEPNISDNHPQVLVLDYTNWRSERRIRWVLPVGSQFEVSQWHPEPQWVLNAVDIEDGKLKSFALAGIHRAMTKRMYEESKNKEVTGLVGTSIRDTAAVCRDGTLLRTSDGVTWTAKAKPVTFLKATHHTKAEVRRERARASKKQERK